MHEEKKDQLKRFREKEKRGRPGSDLYDSFCNPPQAEAGLRGRRGGKRQSALRQGDKEKGRGDSKIISFRAVEEKEKTKRGRGKN